MLKLIKRHQFYKENNPMTIYFKRLSFINQVFFKNKDSYIFTKTFIFQTSIHNKLY